MARIAIGEIMHESSTFAARPTEVESFQKSMLWLRNAEMMKLTEMGMKDFVTGMIEKTLALGNEPVCTFCAAAPPSGTISASCYQQLKENLLAELKQAEAVDGVLLAVHGAGVAEQAEDMEGDLFQAVKEVVGDAVPVVATLDLHANVTRNMAAFSDVMIPTKLYPHTDTYETGEKAAWIMDQMLKKAIRPTTAAVKIPLLVPITRGCTAEQPMAEMNTFCAELEKQTGILDCAVAHGFPYSDIEEAGACVLVAADGNRELAEETAWKAAEYMWSRRTSFLSQDNTVKEGVRLAWKLASEGNGPVVLNEVSDNPGAGTPGDGTHLLRELLKQNHPGSCIGAIIDPEAVKQALRAGVGNKVDLILGGKSDDKHGAPVTLKDAYVKAAADGVYHLKSPMTHGAPVNFGPAVRLCCGNVDIVAASHANQVMDDGLFNMLGINVIECNLVGVKSAQHFKAFFRTLTDHIIPVDPPGISTGKLEFFRYEKVKRPVYPLDSASECKINAIL